ncbi:MAG: hypothetical protein Edafosvirus40_2 [Edafosvirus sp.]|uniref:Uncharacterized protein n=1 Tax=Edafosvirus sp. TaxID=2487765 RepID=A0A3G4ZVD8_9VIRU|nr:MAG: hypothetical protein Edafosvirus40_2 [Edafosvirus sp.]
MSVCKECVMGYKETKCCACNGFGFEICKCKKENDPCRFCDDKKKLTCYHCDGIGVIRTICIYCETALQLFSYHL